jgi:hypothetical protein
MSTFKRFLPLSLITATMMLTISCQKHIPVIPKDAVNQACSNGLFDGNEQDLDCGGDCAPCAAARLTPPCRASFDSLYFSGSGYQKLSSIAESNYGCGNYCVTATTSGGIPVTLLMYSKPTQTRIFNLTPNDCFTSTLSYPDFFFMMDTQGGSNYYVSANGKVYALVNGTHITYVFCSVHVTNNFGGTETMSGSITL